VGLWIGLCLAATAQAQCTPPLYGTVRDFVSPQLGRGAVYLQIQPLDFTLANVICLLRTFKNDHPEWKDVVVLFFTSAEAAEKFDPGGMNDFRQGVDAAGRPLWVEDISWTRRELRGLYVLDRENGEEYFSITPFGVMGADIYNTRIDFPFDGGPHCRLEVANRCLFALDVIEYPADALTARASATVVLIGSISRDGFVQPTVVSSADAFGRSADSNVRTWWFEPASREDSFRITYSYEIDATLEPGESRAEFSLPDRVTIRANPK
jgi:hypothetical protein